MRPSTAALDSENDRIAEALQSIFAARPWIAAVWLFGSRTQGRARRDSDLDLAILTVRRRPDPARLGEELALLERDIGRAIGPVEVDLIFIELQGLPFQHVVLTTGRLIHEKDRERRVDWESDTIVRAIDFLPTYEIYLGEINQGIRRRLGLP
ncbi:MAG: nucleotidyltransferase domain-containing protein [Planctomycetes bacterium]|nr:nucleotidyltransferase domain-containing protein [Planctomycetota bacterium]